MTGKRMGAPAPAAAAEHTLTPILYQHDDGRYGLSFGPATFAIGVPAWHRVPLDVIETPPAAAPTTLETPFCLADTSGQHLFAVREGVNAGTALSTAADMLRTAERLLLNAGELGDDDQQAAGLQLLEAAAALVESVSRGGRRP